MYTDSDILEFQQKDKRIMFQSIFSSLCTLYANDKDDNKNPAFLEELSNQAFKIVNRLVETYPMKEINQTIKNRAGGQPF